MCSLGLRIRELRLRSANGRPAAKGRHSATRENERESAGTFVFPTSHAMQGPGSLTRPVSLTTNLLYCKHDGVKCCTFAWGQNAKPRSSPPRAKQDSYSLTVSVRPCFGELEPEIDSRVAENGSRGDSWQYSGKRTFHCPQALGERRYDAKMKGEWLTIDLDCAECETA